MSTMTGGQAVAEILRLEGVKYVFGVPGTTELPFLDALEGNLDIKYISSLHEIIAIGMAEGYARASGKVGVVNLHTLPGVASAIGGLINAHGGGIPLVLTAGQQDSRQLMEQPELSGDLKTMVTPFTKWSTEVYHVPDIPLAFRRAFKIAKHPPTGPVFVSLPVNLQSENFEFEYIPSMSTFAGLPRDQKAIEKAAELLASAQAPAIIVGWGVTDYNAVPEVVKLAGLTGARVYKQWMADMDFPGNHPQYLDDIFSLPNPKIVEILKATDVMVGIGIPIFRRLRYLPNAVQTSSLKIIQIDDDPWEIAKNFPPAVAVEGDIKASVAELCNALERKMTPQAQQAAISRAKEITIQKEKARQAFLKKVEAERDAVPISDSRLMQELGECLEPGTLIVDESWTSGPPMRQLINFTEPKSFYRLRDGGNIGWGMAAALGVKLASPDRPVVAVVGDGAAIFSIQSLWVAAHYNIPVTFIICANGCYRAIKPPSTGSACPVTNEAASEQSHTTAWATSSGWPIRPMGCMFIT